MALFDNWFAKKAAAKATPPKESSGLEYVDATVPFVSSKWTQRKPPAPKPVSKAPPPPADESGARKGIRLGRREQLYLVVREAMARSGVLTSSYKYKVLSLDAQGRQYLVMIDLARALAANAQRLSDIEVVIAQTARAQHDILVTAVYWRANENVSAGLAEKKVVAPTASAGLRGSGVAPAVAAPATVKNTEALFEPVLGGEVAALRLALTTGAMPLTATPSTAAKAPAAFTPRPRDFADTEVFHSEDQTSPLGATQYGELR